MKKTFSLAAALFLSSTTAGQVAAQNSPPPAPSAGAPAIFVSNADLRERLAESIENGRALSSASVTLTDEYRASLIRRTEANTPIAHRGNTEMHYIVEGRGTVETGGTIVRPDDGPATIEGGESHPVVPGDIIVIPQGSAHRYSEIIEPIVYLEFRFVAPE